MCKIILRLENTWLCYISAITKPFLWDKDTHFFWIILFIRSSLPLKNFTPCANKLAYMRQYFRLPTLTFSILHCELYNTQCGLYKWQYDKNFPYASSWKCWCKEDKLLVQWGKFRSYAQETLPCLFQNSTCKSFFFSRSIKSFYALLSSLRTYTNMTKVRGFGSNATIFANEYTSFEKNYGFNLCLFA